MAQVRTQHPKAKLTPLGRQAMVDLVIVGGWGGGVWGYAGF